MAEDLARFGSQLTQDLAITVQGDTAARIPAAVGELDMSNSQSIIFFGTKAQQQLTTVSDTMLEAVRTKDIGPAGNALNRMVQKLRELDFSDLDPRDKPNFFERLFGIKNEVLKYIDQYEGVRDQIDKIMTELEQHKTTLLTDVVKLDKLYDANLDYFRTLEVYIAAGRAKIEGARRSDHPGDGRAGREIDDVVEAQNLRDLRAARDDLERRVHDLLLTRQVTMQSLPSIRLVQENDKSLITKINSTVANTVPLWRQQLAQAITIFRAGQAAESVKAASDLTNELLKQNADEPEAGQRRGARADGARRVRHQRRARRQRAADRDHRGQPADRGRGQAEAGRGGAAAGRVRAAAAREPERGLGARAGAGHATRGLSGRQHRPRPGQGKELMALMDKLLGEFVDIIEWTDDSQDTMVYRFERYGNEIKYGAKLTVRESQVGGPGQRGRDRRRLQARHVRARTRQPADPLDAAGLEARLREPVQGRGLLRLNTKRFTDLKWGTKNPIMLRDPEFGPVRLRAFGTYVVRVADPAVFLREIVGTDGRFTTDEIADQLRDMIVARFAGVLGGSGIPVLDLAANYDQLGQFVTGRIAPEFANYGLELRQAAGRERLAAAGGRAGAGPAHLDGRGRRSAQVHPVPGGRGDAATPPAIRAATPAPASAWAWASRWPSSSARLCVGARCPPGRPRRPRRCRRKRASMSPRAASRPGRSRSPSSAARPRPAS